MAKIEERRKTIIKAAMDAAARDGWWRLSMTDIAHEAGVSLADLYDVFPSKQRILHGLVDEIDKQVLAGTKSGGKAGAEAEEDSPRDRLFDVLMRRFDALNPYKDGIAAVMRDCTRPRPVGCAVAEALCSGQRLLRSMRWMLEAAEIRTTGLVGMVRVKGLAAVYGSTFMVWLRDDSEDMARTMAALDKRLARAERFASMGGRYRRRREPEEEAAGGANGGEAPQPT